MTGFRATALSRIAGRPFLSAALLFFAYSACAAAAVQFIVLPYVLPSMHGGNGLMAGSDFLGYHGIAAHMAAAITHDGWSAWQLLPQGQSAAGVAAAIYALTWPEPWVLIPYNAAMHAAGGIIIMRLIHIVTANVGVAFWSSVMYVALPSSMHWISQIQKDATLFAGVLAIILGLVMAVHAACKAEKPSGMYPAAAITLAGLVLVALSKMYVLELIRAVTLILAIVIAPAVLRLWTRKELPLQRIGLLAVFFAATIFVAGTFSSERRFDRELPNLSLPQGVGGEGAPADPDQSWQGNQFLPEVLDQNLKRLAVARNGWTGRDLAHAGSMIDLELNLTSPGRFLAYLPRALQVGFAAPFPEHWIVTGAAPARAAMRALAGLEMLLLYPVLFIGLPLAAWRWRHRVELWMIVIAGTALLLVFTYAIPNLGALYRLRYGFLMLLAALGTAALLESRARLSRSKAPEQNRAAELTHTHGLG